MINASIDLTKEYEKDRKGWRIGVFAKSMNLIRFMQ